MANEPLSEARLWDIREYAKWLAAPTARRAISDLLAQHEADKAALRLTAEALGRLHEAAIDYTRLNDYLRLQPSLVGAEDALAAVKARLNVEGDNRE